MRKITPLGGALVAGGLLACFGALPAQADPAVDSTISGGVLTSSISPATLSAVTLDGTNKTSTGDASSPWSVTDARGTGTGWTLQVSATDLTSAAGTADQDVRTISVSALTVTPGAVTAGSGSDSTDNITATPVTLSNTSQALVSATGSAKGTYTFTPNFSLAIPANAYRSNYSGVIGSSSVNPYTSTLTYTIG